MKKDFKKVKISTKLFLAAFVLGGFFIILVTILVISLSGNLVRESRIREFVSDTSQQTTTLSAVFGQVEDDVLFLLNTPPIQGIIRARDNGGFDEEGDSSLSLWKERLSQIFLSEVVSKKIFSQIRYLDEFGNEVVRVNYDVNGNPTIVEEEYLQNKSARTYFQETMKLDEGQVYVSSPNLNREGINDEIEFPLNPQIRYATPVFDVSGQRRGIIIINAFFDVITFSAQEYLGSGVVTLVDQNGYYLSHPDDTKLWGSPNDLNHHISLQTDDPRLFDLVIQNERGFFEDRERVFAYSKMFLDTDRDKFIVLIEDLSNDVFFQDLSSLNTRIILAAIFSFVVIIFLYFFVLKYLLKPIENLIQKIFDISSGGTDKMINSLDPSLGPLATAFDSIIDELQDSKVFLQKEIDRKTKSLKEALKLADDQKIAMLNALEDIESEKNKAEELKSRLQIAQKAAKFGVWEWDILDNTLSWDEQMYEIYHVNKNKFKGVYEAWQNALHPDDREEAEKTINQAVKTGKNFDSTFRIVLPGGAVRYIKADAIPIKNSKNEVVKMIGVNFDITQSMEVDKAKTEFVSLASHQLRTPLSAISWYAEMLISGDAGKITKKQKDYVQEIYTGASRMVALVNSLLNVSRLELGTFAVEPKVIDPTKALKSEIQEVLVKAKQKNIKIKTNIDSTLRMIKADPNLLSIIFLNLLTNAIKYSPEKTTIDVSLERIKKGSTVNSQKVKNDSYLYKVKDHGYGIPDDQKDKIFTKLFRADNIRQYDTDGTGLGLYIMKQVVENIGGQLWFESKIEKGSTFYVLIPEEMKKRSGNRAIEKGKVDI